MKNMKKLIGLLLIGGACFLIVPESMSVTLPSMMSDDTKEIDLSRDLPTNKQRSLIKPVEAFITEKYIRVDFCASLGLIEISIYDEGGNAVYQQSVNTDSGMHIVIDISSFEEGEYTIAFTSSQGLYLSGSFVIQ